MDAQAGTRPSPTATEHVLPFAHLSPYDFERMCLWLVRREGYERAEHVGAAGAEHGRDIVAWRKDRPVSVICKRVRRTGRIDLLRDLDNLSAANRPERSQDVLFLVTCDVSGTAREAANSHWRRGQVQVWGSTELDERVRRHQSILDTFFRLPATELARPRYRDDEARRTAEKLEELQVERALRVARAADTDELDREIVALKRALRDGPDLSAGDWLGDRFQLLEPMASGGFATVWRAWDRQLRQLVAAKVLHPQYARDQSRIARFFRGARQMARLDHPGIVRVLYDQGEESGGYSYFVMEFLPGGDLAEAVRRGEVPRQRALQLILSVGEALQFAHDRGLVHRDIKPSNILLDSGGRPKLTDFDLVWAADTTGGTRTGALGTVLYSSPEAWDRAKDVGPRADVYSLAMTLLFCLHGEHLPHDVLRDPEPFTLRAAGDERVARVLSSALAWGAAERTTSVAEFCRQLRQSTELQASEADHLLDRLHADGAELRDSQVIGEGRRMIRARIPKHLRDAYGTAPEILVVDAKREIEGSDIREAVAELDRRRFDVDPDLLLVTDGRPRLAERLSYMRGGLPSQCLAWTGDDGGVPLRPLTALFRAELPRFDVFDELYPIRGRSVVGRAQETAEITRRLLRGQSIGLFGLRKVGKTTLLRVVTDRADPVSGLLPLPDDRRLASLPPSTLMVAFFDGQDALLRPTVDYVAARLAKAVEARLELAGLNPPQSAEHPLERLSTLLDFAIAELAVPLCIVIDEYDYLFERTDGSAAIPGIESLFGLLRARAQQRPGALALVLMGRDPRVLERPELGGLPNPLLNWLMPRWVGPLVQAEADELLRRLGRRVLLDVDDTTAALAFRWTGGHPLLLRQFGSALLGSANSLRAAESGHMPTAPLCDEATDRYVERAAVRDICQEVDVLLVTRYPSTARLFHRLCDAPTAPNIAVVPPGDAVVPPGDATSDDTRRLLNFGLLSQRQTVPEVFRWYRQTQAPRPVMAPTGT